MKTAKRIVQDILDEGLGDSTWKEQFPEAYKDLLTYRNDIEASVGKDVIATKILIIVPHYWGKGESITEAWEQVKQSSHSNLRDLKRGPWRIYVVYDTDDVQTYVNEMGAICYPSDHKYVMIEENKNPK